jgi:hypothetical protein
MAKSIEKKTDIDFLEALKRLLEKYEVQISVNNREQILIEKEGVTIYSGYTLHPKDLE